MFTLAFPQCYVDLEIKSCFEAGDDDGVECCFHVHFLPNKIFDELIQIDSYD